MKKVRWMLMAVAIVAGIGGAVASRTCGLCEYAPQYKLLGGNYVPAGEFGQDYICSSGGGVCTFWRPSPFGGYIPCRTGTYIPIPH